MSSARSPGNVPADRNVDASQGHAADVTSASAKSTSASNDTYVLDPSVVLDLTDLSAVPYLCFFRRFSTPEIENEYVRYFFYELRIPNIVTHVILLLCFILFTVVQDFPYEDRGIVVFVAALFTAIMLIWHCLLVFVGSPNIEAEIRKAYMECRLNVGLSTVLIILASLAGAFQGRHCYSSNFASDDVTCGRTLRIGFGGLTFLPSVFGVDPLLIVPANVVVVYADFLMMRFVGGFDWSDCGIKTVLLVGILIAQTAFGASRDRVRREQFESLLNLAHAVRTSASHQKRLTHVVRCALPPRFAARLSRINDGVIPLQDLFDEATNATLCVTEVTGFADWSTSQLQEAAITALHRLFTIFDDAVKLFGIDHGSTFGDSYAVTGRLISGNRTTTDRMVRFALWQLHVKFAMTKVRRETLAADHAGHGTVHRRGWRVPNVLSPDNGGTEGTAEDWRHEEVLEEGQGLRLHSVVVDGPLVGGMSGKRELRYFIAGPSLRRAQSVLPMVPPGAVWAADTTVSNLTTNYHGAAPKGFTIRPTGMRDVMGAPWYVLAIRTNGGVDENSHDISSSSPSAANCGLMASQTLANSMSLPVDDDWLSIFDENGRGPEDRFDGDFSASDDDNVVEDEPPQRVVLADTQLQSSTRQAPLAYSTKQSVPLAGPEPDLAAVAAKILLEEHEGKHRRSDRRNRSAGTERTAGMENVSATQMVTFAQVTESDVGRSTSRGNAAASLPRHVTATASSYRAVSTVRSRDKSQVVQVSPASINFCRGTLSDPSEEQEYVEGAKRDTADNFGVSEGISGWLCFVAAVGEICDVSIGGPPVTGGIAIAIWLVLGVASAIIVYRRHVFYTQLEEKILSNELPNSDPWVGHTAITLWVVIRGLIFFGTFFLTQGSHVSQSIATFALTALLPTVFVVASPWSRPATVLYGVVFFAAPSVGCILYQVGANVDVVVATAAAVTLYAVYGARYPGLRRIQYHMAQQVALAQQIAAQHSVVLTALLRRIVPEHVAQRGAWAVDSERTSVAADHHTALSLLRSAQMGDRIPTSPAVVDEYLDLTVVYVRIDSSHKWRGAVKAEHILQMAQNSASEQDDMFVSGSSLREMQAAALSPHMDEEDEGPLDGKGIINQWARVADIITEESGDFLEHVQSLGDTFVLAGPFSTQPPFQFVQRAALAVVRILSRMDDELQLRFTAVATVDEGTGALVGRGALRYGVFGVSVRHCEALLNALPPRPVGMLRAEGGVAYATRSFVTALSPQSTQYREVAVPPGETRLGNSWVNHITCMPDDLFELEPVRLRVRAVGITYVWKIDLIAAINVLEAIDEVEDDIDRVLADLRYQQPVPQQTSLESSLAQSFHDEDDPDLHW